MKTKLSIFIFCLLGIFNYSQIVYSNSNLQMPSNSEIKENTLQETFSHLDKAKIPNGLLLDAAIEFIDLKKYNGTMPDSSYTSSKAVVDIYNTLVMSRLHSSAQISKTTTDFTTNWKNAQLPDIVPLGAVFYKYAQFSETVNQNVQNTGNPMLLTVNGNYLEDKYVNGVWQNPYEEKYAFAIAPSINSFNKFNFKLVLPDNLFLSNQNSNIQKIEYRLADDRPYQILPKNQLIPVSYTAKGTYHWTFKLTLNSGEVLYTHTQFVVDGNLDNYVDVTNPTSRTSNLGQYSKVLIDPYIIPGTFTWSPPILKAKATMYIKLAPGHSQITKPLIVAEGFDVGAILSPSKEAGTNNINDFIESLKGHYPLKNILESDYDIIYVDWGNGTDYIQNNAQYLKKAIQYVNANKVGGNKNVVIGQSMGGLIARFALKDMEDLGLNHDTQLYISHDSPHLGANIPIGLQNMLVNVSRTYVKAPLIAGIGEFIVPVFNQGIAVSDILTITGTPAARQMLLNYVNMFYHIDNNVHNNWQNELKAKGYPQQLRRVAISNGSECGTDQTLQDLLRIYKETSKQHLFSDVLGVLLGVATFRLDMIVLAALPGSSKYVFDFTVRPMTSVNENKQLYNGSIKYKKKILWVINSQVSLLSGSSWQPSNILPYDKYGGGRYILARNSLPASIANDVSITPFSFISTPSSLDYKFGNAPLLETDYQKSFAPAEDLQNVPFANFVAETVNDNHSHISFNSRNGQFIINQLSPDINVQNEKLTSTNFCSIKIEINGEDLICDSYRFTTPTNLPNLNWSIVEGNDIMMIEGANNQSEVKLVPVAPILSHTKKSGFVGLRVSGGFGNSEGIKRFWYGVPNYRLIEKSGVWQDGAGVQIAGISSNGSIEPIQKITNIQFRQTYSNNGYLRSDYNWAWAYPTVSPPKKWSVWGEVEVSNKCGVRKGDFRVSNGELMDAEVQRFSIDNLANNMYKITLNNTDTNYRSAQVLNNKFKISVFNFLMNEVYVTDKETFDLSFLPKGNYIIKAIVNDTEVISRNIIIQ